MEKKKIGIIGLGLMGYGIALNLIKNGFHVVGADINEQACESARELGAEIAQNAAQVGNKCRYILVSMSSEKAYYSVIEDLRESCVMGSIVIETSTLSLGDKEEGRSILAGSGIVMIDAPISGNSKNVISGGAVAMASGEDAAVNEIGHILDGFCKKWYNVGKFGNGSKMKFVANHQTAVHSAGVAEALYFAHKLGLDLNDTVDIIGQGGGACAALNIHGPLIAKRAWNETTNRVMKNFKDQRITCELIGELNCPAPMYKAAVVLTKRTAELGHEDHDRAAIYDALEKMDLEGLKLTGVDSSVDRDTI